jgi:hypothetical protein
MIRRMRALLTILAALAAFPAAAGCIGSQSLPEPGPIPEAVPFHFQRTAARGLACAVPAEQGADMAAHRRPTSYLPCLKVGAVSIADTLKSVEAALGKPDAITSIDWRTEARAYFIAQRSIPHPYYVVTFQDDVAVAVQLLGPPTEMPARFSGLSLGDPAQAVLDSLGKPSRRCPGKERSAETWVWHPFPIGVDIRDGHVIGFKVTWPAGR